MRCPGGHNFDVARQGYLNLLVGGRLARQRQPGDDEESLRSRRRFLDAGHYAPIADALCDAVDAVLTGGPTDDAVVFDVGCGEGYYTRALAAVGSNAIRFGLDVAKSGVRLAAGQDHDGHYVVGSAYRLPVLDRSVDVVTSVFAPRPISEFQRILRQRGAAVTVTPASDHLGELLSERGTRPGAASRAERREQAPVLGARRVSYTLTLDDRTQRELIRMTPLNWQRGIRHEPISTVTVDVWVSTLCHGQT